MLVRKFDSRPVVLVAAALGSLAHVLSIFANSVEYLFVTLGVMAGNYHLNYIDMNINKLILAYSYSLMGISIFFML